MPEVDRALVDEVEQAAGGGDQHVEAARHGAQRLGIGNAAEDHADGSLEAAAIGFGAGGDLRGELTGRGEHQHADLAGLEERRAIGGEALQRRRHEGGRLAGAGLGNAEQVSAFQHVGDGLRLDRRGRGVILGRKRGEQGLREPELFERHSLFSNMIAPASGGPLPEWVFLKHPA